MFGVWGRSAKLDVVLPYAWVSGTAEVAGQRRERDVSGFGDPRIRVSGLLYGGPALSLEDFADYKPDFIVGASLAVTLPLGQYDSDKLVNTGTNRWSVKPELGVSKTFGPVTLELAPSVTFYTDNHDFLGAKTLEKSPLYAVQGHVIYHTRFGLWVAVDATYYRGGRATVDGQQGEEPEKPPRRRDARGPDQQAQLGQALRQYGRRRARRRQLHRGRHRLAIPLGRRALVSP